MNDLKTQTPLPAFPRYPSPRTDVSLLHWRPVTKLSNGNVLRRGGCAVQLADGLQVGSGGVERGGMTRAEAGERADVGVCVRGEVSLVDRGRVRVLHAVVWRVRRRRRGRAVRPRDCGRCV